MTDNRTKIVDFVRRHPEMTYGAIAKQLGIAYSTLSKMLNASGFHRRSYRRLDTVDIGAFEQEQ